jgi:hypothetical protein
MLHDVGKLHVPDSILEVLAAGFPERVGAFAAVAELRRVLDVGDQDLSIDEVGASEEFVDGATIVVGGRIRESRLQEVHKILRRHGGVILTEVPERWVRSSNERRRHADDCVRA